MKIIEVGPRDGLQNEAVPIPTEVKLAFIRGLVEAGLQEIEATSFVSPKWVPQMGDAAELWPQLPSGGTYSALVPNLKGLESALAVGCDRIAVFTAASDAFTQKNINKSVKESIEVFREVIEAFRASSPGGFVRGYVSTAFECPYAGKVEPGQVVEVCERLLELGVDEISIGDTIGAAATNEVHSLTRELLEIIPLDSFAYHFHDTRGSAIANVAAALEHGIHRFDASAAGLGGCPYAPGAGGNLATEDLVYFLERNGVATGVDLAKLAHSSRPVIEHLGRVPVAKAQVWALATETR